ncbi:Crp/Fnr family transcriptional regulator [Novosphingobium album (ex Liu et al. 2023)]|uniref:Crp/Fnr family transcriptional regulator n=1 Tax=Novosphingobium album (ex Liu et al. 2023) TaxID=3031130 RepID=A0ABT5WM51_9SPHN|nr:Crp/Fnr family transcriptional regulator [Novosphingobium album (ex Liu et al. 2023)]MDE8651107.1 Crp/Fnr family transcriptional regulator [Novosphingobium album (ex Liu et al. 2023)]
MSGSARLDALLGLLPAPIGEALLPHARLATLRSGQIVMGHQDATNEVFVVIEGSLRIELVSRNGREIILNDAGPGDLVGEFAALDDQPRSATVTATSKSTLARIPGAAFKEAMLGDPRCADWLTKRLVRLMRGMTERVFELNALAVRSRLHCELLRLSLDAGITGNSALIAPSPTHVELANRIGTHREAVTRELQYLQKQGITVSEGRRLSVEDVTRLAEIVRAAAGDVELIQRASQAGIGRALD